jgi:hypothetical protein
MNIRRIIILLLISLVGWITPVMGADAAQVLNVTVITQEFYVPFEWFALLFVIGCSLMFAGLYLREWMFELGSAGFFFVCSIASAITADVSVEIINQTTIQPVVYMSFAPWVALLCNGLASIAMFLFVLLLIYNIMNWLNDRKMEKSHETMPGFFNVTDDSEV